MHQFIADENLELGDWFLAKRENAVAQSWLQAS